MTLFTAISNSTIFDVCLNTYGTLDHLVKLMVDSGHADVDTDPVNGQEYLYDPALAVKNGNTNLSSQYNSLTNLSSQKFATQ